MLDPKTTVALFPGQGSQKIGMGRALAEAFPVAWETFAAADEILGFPLTRLMWEGPKEALNDTANTQPALLTHSLAAWRVLQEIAPDFRPAYMAGHSLGELSALTAAGALDFADAVCLVRVRGEAMRRAGEENPGRVAAILGLEAAQVEALCAQVSTPKAPVQVANDNSPGQVVVAGATPAVEAVIQKAREAGARRVLPLKVSVPVHTVLMEPARATFTAALEQVTVHPPQVPVIGNTSAQPLTTADEVRAELAAQLTGRVRWTETMRYLLSQGMRTFLELGSGTVLLNLAKRFDRSLRLIPLGTPGDFEGCGDERSLRQLGQLRD
ncbi:MAG TPA: ACP S-malonyltransferase [Anaerolineae bacterium]|nr:ACP S-malonyltransferase [Anaerolineae bacterium]